MDRSHANCNFVLSSRVNWFTLVDTRSLSTSFTVKTLSYTVGNLYSATISHVSPGPLYFLAIVVAASFVLPLYPFPSPFFFSPCFPTRCNTRTSYFPSCHRRDSRRRFPTKPIGLWRIGAASSPDRRDPTKGLFRIHQRLINTAFSKWGSSEIPARFTRFNDTHTHRDM